MMRPHGIVTIIWKTIFKIATHLGEILSDTDLFELKKHYISIDKK